MNGLRGMLLLAALLASSAAAPLSRIGGIDVMGDFTDVQTIGNIAYVASGATGLMIFDVSNASSPKLLSSSADCIGCNTTAQYVTVDGTTAYVVPVHYYDTPGPSYTVFAIVDVSTPSSPRQLGVYEMEYKYYPNCRIFVSGSTFWNYVFAPNLFGTIDVVDVSTPSSPSLVKRIDLGFRGGVRSSYYIAGGTLFAYSKAVLHFIDVSTPSVPGPPRKMYTKNFDNPLFSVVGSHLYVYYGGGASVTIIDFSIRGSERQIGTFGVIFWATSFSVSGNTAYLGSKDGLYIYDITRPSTPVGSSLNAVSALSVSGTKVFAGVLRSLVVFDVSDPSSPQPVNDFHARDMMMGLELFGSMAAVATSRDLSNLTMQTYDVRDASSPQELSSLLVSKNGLATNFLALSGTTVYLPFVEGGYVISGVQTVSVSDPSKPTVLGTYTANDTNYVYIAVDGTTAYAINEGYKEGFMDIIDASVPSSPSLLGTFRYNGARGNGGDVNGVTVNNGFAYIITTSTTNTSLCIVDVHHPQSPTLFTTLEDLPCEGTETVTSIAMHGTTVYYSCYGIFGIIDIKDASSPSPQLIGGYTAQVFDFIVDGNTVYLASYAQLLVLDVSRPSSPQLVDSHFIPAALLRVHISGFQRNFATHTPLLAVSGGRVYVASYGLYVFGELTPTAPPTSAPSTAPPTSAPPTAPPTSAPSTAPPTSGPSTPVPDGTPAPSENSNDTLKIVAIVAVLSLVTVIAIGVACYCKAKKVPVSEDEALADFGDTNDGEDDYGVAA